MIAAAAADVLGGTVGAVVSAGAVVAPASVGGSVEPAESVVAEPDGSSSLEQPATIAAVTPAPAIRNRRRSRRRRARDDGSSPECIAATVESGRTTASAPGVGALRGPECGGVWLA
jgi:hypothetical protein